MYVHADLLWLVDHTQRCHWRSDTPLPHPAPCSQRTAVSAGSAAPRQHSIMHPQMLRLDHLVLEDQQQSAETAAAAAAGLPFADTQAQKARKARLLPFSAQLKADDWLIDLELKGCQGPLPAGPPPELLLDMNDPGMTFEVLRGTEVEEYANAAAVILPAMPKVRHCIHAAKLILHMTIISNNHNTFWQILDACNYSVVSQSVSVLSVNVRMLYFQFGCLMTDHVDMCS